MNYGIGIDKGSMMNRHMNLFRFYGESKNSERIEDNLTRGLALCLKYDTQFINSFISEIDPAFRLSAIPRQSAPYFDVNIQVQATDLEEAERVIAVPLTVADFPETEYRSTVSRSTDSPVIDLVISYADTVVICEIKPSKQNCLAQLKNQVERYNPDIEEAFSSLSWSRISSILEGLNNLNSSMSVPNLITRDYLVMLKGHFPSWQPILKLNELTENTDHLSYDIEKRLIAVCNDLPGMQLLEIGGRLGFKLNWLIASELKIQPVVPKDLESMDDIFVEIKFWMGDTKGQGKYIFKNGIAEAILDNSRIDMNGVEYEISTEPYVKFAHFQRSVAELGTKDILNERNFNQKLFSEIAGRRKKPVWDLLDAQLSKLNPDWVEKSKWNETFINSNRTVVDISMGVCVKVKVPFIELRKKEENSVGLRDYLGDLLESLNNKFGVIGR